MDNYLDSTGQDHIDSLTDSVRLSRRGFAVTSLAAGFAAAVSPVAKATITTDSDGLAAGEVKIPVADGVAPGYRAMPAKGTHFPTIIVIQEIFGVHEHIRDLCRRLAKLGYYAIATELYARQGDVSKLTDIQDIMKVVATVPNDQVMSDLDASVAFAKGEKADTAKLGVTGFCYGGGKTWLYTAHNPDVKAGVAWYGPLVGQPGRPGPYPIDVAGQIKGRVLGLYGGKDTGITEDARNQMLAALKAAGDTKSKIIVYPDAQHGFNADYRPSYNEAAAKDGWAKMLAWFKGHGVA
jgi:carboxymethylenebutenolidase